MVNEVWECPKCEEDRPLMPTKKGGNLFGQCQVCRTRIYVPIDPPTETAK